MANESFGRFCQELCDALGWELLPAGMRVLLGGGRQQLVDMELFEFEGQELVRLTTRIGDASALDDALVRVALRANAELARGALALSDGSLVMTATLSIGDGGRAEMESAVRYLAARADDYERTLFGTDEN